MPCCKLPPVSLCLRILVRSQIVLEAPPLPGSPTSQQSGTPEVPSISLSAQRPPPGNAQDCTCSLTSTEGPAGEGCWMPGDQFCEGWTCTPCNAVPGRVSPVHRKCLWKGLLQKECKGLHLSAWAGLLRQQSFTFSQLWRVEVQGQGVGRVGSWRAVFSVFSRRLPSVCVCVLVSSL